MGYRRDTFAIGEWYHCYSRGVDRRIVYESDDDYQRFLGTLYVSNDTHATHRDNFKHLSYQDLLQLERADPLVAIGAYCLMPNHFHLLIKEIKEGGITKFMHKLGTSYTMYFNIKNDREGNLFVKPFRSKHVADDRYFRRVAQYIHLNAAELCEPHWKEGRVRSIKLLEKTILAHGFSSLPEYCGAKRFERDILDKDAFELLQEGLPSLSEVLSETADYYATLR